MELLPYPNLHDERDKIQLDDIPQLVAQIASAARFLEDRHLAHRDIKPENIAVSPDHKRAVLLDLGVIRPIGASDLTDVDQRFFIGTLRYSSPEFLERKEEDSIEGWRSITFYQLGAVLHDLLMKKVLFDEHSEPFSLLVRAVHESIPEIHAENTACVSLANHCLLKNPKTRHELVTWERFQSLTTSNTNTLAATRARIKERQTYYLAVGDQQAAAKQQPRLSRKSLDDICNRVETRIAALINAMQAFPLRTTSSHKDLNTGVCQTCVHFEKDPQKGLIWNLTVAVKLALIDENKGNPIFHATSTAVITDGEIVPATLSPTSAVLSGEVELILDSAEFEGVFINALDQAYACIEAGSIPVVGEALSLDTEAGKT